MKRSTFSVNKFREWANNVLARPTDRFYPTQEEKRAICTALEHILMETGNYHGFNYTKWLNGGSKEWVEAGRPVNNQSFLGLEYDRFYF